VTMVGTTTSGWQRPARAEVLDIAPLGKTEITELAGASLGRPTPELIAGIREATGGLPMHVAEVLRSGAKPPFGSLDELIGARVSALGAVAQSVLSAIAISGGQAETSLLEAIGVVVTNDAIAELEQAGFVTRTGTRLTITHPRHVEVVRERTSDEVSRATHTALWRHMEERKAKATLIAVHAAGSKKPEAIEVLEQAGLLAQHEF